MLDDFVFALGARPFLSLVVGVLFGGFGFAASFAFLRQRLPAPRWNGRAPTAGAALFGAGIAAGAILLVGSTRGDLVRAYRLAGPEGTRIALVYELRSGKASDTCRVRVVSRSGELVGQAQSVWRDGCERIGPATGRHLWLARDTGWFSDHPYDAVAIDLYTGRATTEVLAALERAGYRGQFRAARAQTVRGAFTVELQDGQARSITWDGRVLGAGELPPVGEPVGVLTLAVETTPYEASGVHRAEAISSSCGCEVHRCGELIQFYDTAFGEGRRYLGLHADGALRWRRSFEALFGEDAALEGIAAEDGQCLIVSGGDEERIVRLDRQSGEASWVEAP